MRFGARFCLGCAILTALFYAAGPWYVKTLLPVFGWELTTLHPEYEIRTLQYDDAQAFVSYKVRIHRREVKNGRVWGGQEVKGGVWASALYIQPILLFSLLFAWPGLSLKDWPKAALIGIPLLVAINLADMPIHIIQKLEEGYAVQSLADSARVFWWNTLNNGGRQFLAIVAFGATVGMVKLVASKPAAERSTGKRKKK